MRAVALLGIPWHLVIVNALLTCADIHLRLAIHNTSFLFIGGGMILNRLIR